MIQDHKIQLLNIAMSIPSHDIDNVIDNYLKLERLLVDTPEGEIVDNSSPTVLPDYASDYTTTSTSCCSSGYVCTEPIVTSLSGTWNCLDKYYPTFFSQAEKFNTEKEPEQEPEQSSSGVCQGTNSNNIKQLSVLEKIKQYVDKNVKTSDPLVKLYAEESAIRDNVNSMLSKKIETALFEIDKELGLEGSVCEKVYSILDAYKEKLMGKTVLTYDCSDPNEANLSDLLKKFFSASSPVQISEESKEFVDKLIHKYDKSEPEPESEPEILDESDSKEVEQFKSYINSFLQKYKTQK